MKISYEWLQSYFEKPLPEPAKLEEILIFHVFEVEGIEKKGSDTIFDIKTLADRNHYALSHKGIAYEVSALTGIPLKKTHDLLTKLFPQASEKAYPLALSEGRDSELCQKYSAFSITHISEHTTPTWLKERIEAVGQRSINFLVDITNYVLLDIGQPLHVFDADKLRGTITLRHAKAGESIVTLDGKTIQLDPTMFVEADDEGPLAIAGIKGGKRAEVDDSTRNAVFVAGNFKAESVRVTTSKIGIRTDASKRFENSIPVQRIDEGLDLALAIAVSTLKGIKIGARSSVGSPKSIERTVTVTPSIISTILGVSISSQEISTILARLDVRTEKGAGDEIVCHIPSYRLDLTIPADIAEEVGRIYGYDKIPAILPPNLHSDKLIDPLFYYCEKIKNVLKAQGFSETLLYTFVQKGDYEVAYPLASDKKFLRTTLLTNTERALKMNVLNIDILEREAIQMFEIGKVFPRKVSDLPSGETTVLSLSAQQVKKMKGITGETLIKNALSALDKEIAPIFGQATIKNTPSGAMCEIFIEEELKKLPQPKSLAELSFGKIPEGIRYVPISPYPYIVRDIAAFVPEATKPEEMQELIDSLAGPLMVRRRLFDVFSKKMEDGTLKTSYAYRIVFQSNERTLEESEVNTIMQSIYEAASKKGWITR